MISLSANKKLGVTFSLLWFLFHYQVLSYEVIEKCEEGCNHQVVKLLIQFFFHSMSSKNKFFLKKFQFYASILT
jgi:hypothetical protein